MSDQELHKLRDDGSSSTPRQTCGAGNLRPFLGFWALTFYGIGDILGAGIYALIGDVAGVAGRWSPLSFLLAMSIAGLTGLTYAQMVARFPKSGGEASFCLEAFGRPRGAFLVGWLVFCSGVVSMATVAHAFGNYLHALWPELAEAPIWLLFLCGVSLINFRGIRESSLTNILLTCVEVAGLLVVIVAGAVFLMREGVPEAVVSQDVPLTVPGVMSGAVLAFFAYIGFEDMVNVSEEVCAPRTTFPRAIISAVIFCGVLYMAVGLVAVAIVPVAELSAAEAPLINVVGRAAPALPPILFTGIALIAVANTGLLNGIMASRLLYGMSRQGLLPSWLRAVHARTRTPHLAVAVVLAVSLALAFSGTMARLAETTSLLVLIVFATVHASAIRLLSPASEEADLFRVPMIVPILGLVTCLGLITFVSWEAWLTSGVVFLVGVGLTLIVSGSRSESA